MTSICRGTAFGRKLNDIIEKLADERKQKIDKRTRMLERVSSIVALLHKGMSQRQIARILKIPQPTVCYTIKQYRSGFYD